jgi:hypothetical protein
VGITGVLVGAAPPATAEASTEASPAIGPDDVRADLGPYRLRVVVTPAHAGANYIDLYLRDGSGELATPAEVTAEASLPEASVAPITLAVEPREPGHFVAEAAVLPIPGDWDLKVVARRGEFEQFTTTVTVTIRKDTP